MSSRATLSYFADIWHRITLSFSLDIAFSDTSMEAISAGRFLKRFLRLATSSICIALLSVAMDRRTSWLNTYRLLCWTYLSPLFLFPFWFSFSVFSSMSLSQSLSLRMTASDLPLVSLGFSIRTVSAEQFLRISGISPNLSICAIPEFCFPFICLLFISLTLILFCHSFFFLRPLIYSHSCLFSFFSS